MRLLPGDPILIYVTQDNLESSTQEQIDLLRNEFGLDKPIPVQYVEWISGVVRGDLGKSILHRDSVSAEIVRRLPITFHLGLMAFVIAILIGIPAGIISATRRGQWLDTAVTTLANIGITVPIFWLGILFIYFFSLYLGWLPVFGYTSPFKDFWLSTKQVLMPVACLSLFAIASNARQARSSMLEVIRQDYIRTAWSKGLRERSVILDHALKNALIPVVTLAGMMVRNIFGGSVLIETVFSIPGMGRLAVEGILSKDYQVVQGCVLITAVIVLVSNLVVEISYTWLDPRIKYR
jgi:peptide/nickel transport system permease protein